jgi:transposase-like protein
MTTVDTKPRAPSDGGFSIHSDFIESCLKGVKPMDIPPAKIDSMLRMVEKSPNNATFTKFEGSTIMRCTSLLVPYASCPSCSAQELRSNGNAKNTWRLKCNSCKKTASGSILAKYLPTEVVKKCLEKISTASRMKAAIAAKISPARATTRAKGARRSQDDSCLSDQDTLDDFCMVSKNDDADLDGMIKATQNSITESQDNQKTQPDLADTPNCSLVYESLSDSQSTQNANDDPEVEFRRMSHEDLVDFAINIHKRYGLLCGRLNILTHENETLKAKLQAVPQTASKVVYTSMASKSYAAVADLVKPKILTKAPRQEISQQQIDAMFRNTPTTQDTPPTPRPEQDGMKLVFLDGCARTNIAFYRQLLSQKGFPQHLARDMCFLTDTIMQVLTYSSEEQNLIKAFQAISPTIKHLAKFDPTSPQSYGKIAANRPADEVRKSYFDLVDKCRARLDAASKQNPSLRRAANFLHSVFVTGNIEIRPRANQVKCLFLSSMIPAPPPDQLEQLHVADSQ